MNSLRATNVLLAIIAACLLAIVAKAFVPSILPAAQAQSSSPQRVSAALYACSGDGTGGCNWTPVQLLNGGLSVTPTK